jgi:hypothetical protein
MKKTLVMLALSTVGFATVFAAAPVTTPQPLQPASAQQTPANPVEIKKIAGQTNDQKTPVTPTTKPKLVLVVDEKPACSASQTDKKDDQKTPVQSPVKATPAKIALA